MKVLYFKGFLRHTAPHFMAYFGSIFFLLIWGVGVVKIIFIFVSPRRQSGCSTGYAVVLRTCPKLATVGSARHTSSAVDGTQALRAKSTLPSSNATQWHNCGNNCPDKEFLRWHVPHVCSARNHFLELRIVLPQIVFELLLFCGWENSCEIPTNFPCEKAKKITDKLLQERREKEFWRS